MNEDITFCEKVNCNIMSCLRNPKHIRHHDIPHTFGHLEDDPYYCKKAINDKNKYKGEKR